MNDKNLKPAISTLFFIMFFDIILIIQGDQSINDPFIYIVSISFFLLVLSYFTNFLHSNTAIQDKLYDIFIFTGFPFLSTYVVFFENFQTESIFLFFVQLNFYTFYVRHNMYLKSVILGLILGFIFSYVSHNFVFYQFTTKQISSYSLFLFSFFTSIFLWKTTYSQFLASLNAREIEIEENMIMIVHELNRPLATIKLFSQILGDKYKEDDIIYKTTKNISMYINKALFQIKFRKDNLKTYMSNAKVEEIDIKTFIHECVCNYTAINNQSIPVEVEGPSLYINADINFLYSIFMNLLENAGFFINKAGKGYINISLNDQKGRYIICFKDTGTGIKPDVLPMIFKKGYSRRNDGTGMGLFMCRQLIEQLEGSITCHSIYGEYTEFLIELPKNKKTV